MWFLKFIVYVFSICTIDLTYSQYIHIHIYSIYILHTFLHAYILGFLVLISIKAAKKKSFELFFLNKWQGATYPFLGKWSETVPLCSQVNLFPRMYIRYILQIFSFILKHEITLPYFHNIHYFTLLFIITISTILLFYIFCFLKRWNIIYYNVL